MSFCRNKKGLAFQAIIVIILVLFAFTVIVGVVKIITSKTGEAQGIEVCRANIVAANEVKKKAGKEVSTILSHNLLCKTYDKDIRGKNEEVAGMIANLAVKCWYEFGEGRYGDVFGDYFVNNNYCFICYTFTTDYSDKRPVTEADLTSYMSNNIYPNTGKTYLDYIQSYAGEGRIGIHTQTNNAFMKDQYAIALISPVDWAPQTKLTTFFPLLFPLWFTVLDQAKVKEKPNWIIITELKELTSKARCEPVKDVGGQ